MKKREDKINIIIQSTISLLQEEGAGNLSMRKVAERSVMTLSNLQYYYKDKDELLLATAAYYFKRCEEEVMKTWESLKMFEAFPEQKFIREILSAILVEEGQNDFAMFREIWALSLRNKALAESVHQYYRKYCVWLVELISSFSKCPEKVVALLVPYVEGYSIMGSAIPLDKKGTIDLLSGLIDLLNKPDH